jgi:hypothetical protein
LTDLRANGTTLSLDAVWRQAGRHFGDSLEPVVLGFNGTSRQLATETAWRLVSMLRPVVTGRQLALVKPNDQDIQRLSGEILGVGAGLELLRRIGAIDGRTLKKISGRFDFEAYAPGGAARLRIELKGTLNAASRKEHRKSIQAKINFGKNKPRKTRSYDRWIGVVFLGWTAGAHSGVDFEVADPPGRASADPEDALASAAAFYARTFELVGVAGAERFWEFSRRPRMLAAARKALFRVHGVASPFSRVSITMRFADGTELDFGGSFWRSASVPFMRDEIQAASVVLDYCFVGVDRRVAEAMASDEPLTLLSMTWSERSGTFDVPMPDGILVPRNSVERRFRGIYQLSGDGLVYVWSNVIPASGLVDVAATIGG